MSKILAVEHRNKELHIRLGGAYNTKTAALLSVVMNQAYEGQERILVNTDEVTEVADNSRNTLGNLLKMLQLPGSKVFLTGEMGGKIASNEFGVISRSPASSRCENCSTSCSSGKCK
ncbi:MAG: hypothetical protein CSB24_00270 [Deltaproteobacteria bacterium]|nr:MAG: hypothetical protein CSB24_00270 [Deltaproteobacteria bacterium]